MLGTPVTHLPKFAEGDNGYILIADLDDLFIDEVASVQFYDSLDTSKTEQKTASVSLTTMNGYLNASDTSTLPNAAWCKSSSYLYMFFLTDYYAYESHNFFTVFGNRTGIPINDMNDNIDIPEQHIELFIKYAIREAAQILGKQVPPSIERDINQLETKLST